MIKMKQEKPKIEMEAKIFNEMLKEARQQGYKQGYKKGNQDGLNNFTDKNEAKGK